MQSFSIQSIYPWAKLTQGNERHLIIKLCTCIITLLGITFKFLVPLFFFFVVLFVLFFFPHSYSHLDLIHSGHDFQFKFQSVSGVLSFRHVCLNESLMILCEENESIERLIDNVRQIKFRAPSTYDAWSKVTNRPRVCCVQNENWQCGSRYHLSLLRLCWKTHSVCAKLSVLMKRKKAGCLSLPYTTHTQT